jgi:short subunit dehydrogenase-like uncharacterized protein
MITLFGATGYTGRLVARTLDRAGLDYRLAGRSRDKLERLSAELAARPTWIVADATEPPSLDPLFEGSRVLVNCAGPFTDLADPVVSRAALHGVHYLDTTNEAGYVYQVQGYDALARRSGAAIVPACAFEVALADCAAALVAQTLASPPEEVSITYDVLGQGSSLGTRRSAVRALATSWLAYGGGDWVRAAPGRRTRRVELPGGARRALSFPSSEIVTVPHHRVEETAGLRQVTTWMVVSEHARFWAPLLVPAFAWLARGPLGRLFEALLAHILPPPESGLRSDAPFAVQVEARRGDEAGRLTLMGQGVYDLTAEIVAYAAARLARPDHDAVETQPSAAGVLPPSGILEPRAFLDHAVQTWGLVVRGPEAL